MGHILSRYAVFVGTMAMMFLLASCDGVLEGSPPATIVSIPAEFAEISDIEWLRSGYLVADDESNLWYKHQSSSGWRKIVPRASADCTAVFYDLAASWSDPIIRFVQDCKGSFRGKSGWRSTTRISVYSYDLSNDEQQLVADELPMCDYAWHPNSARAICADKNSFFPTLHWVDHSGATPVMLTLMEGDRRWYLPDSVLAGEQYWADLRTGMPSPVGMVKAPAWSPDGSSVAFWATLEPIGRVPELFRLYNWNLYVLEIEGLHTKALLSQVFEPHLLKWSPDGTWLAYLLPKDNPWQSVLELFNIHTGQRVALRTNRFVDLAWSPDGRQILASVLRKDADLHARDLQLIDLAAVVGNRRP